MSTLVGHDLCIAYDGKNKFNMEAYRRIAQPWPSATKDETSIQYKEADVRKPFARTTLATPTCGGNRANELGQVACSERCLEFSMHPVPVSKDERLY